MTSDYRLTTPGTQRKGFDYRTHAHNALHYDTRVAWKVV